VPDGVRVVPTDPGGSQNGVVVRAEERRGDRLVGELEIGVFSAGLVMDRDAVLAEMASAAADRALAPPGAGRLLSVGEVTLEGGLHGFRADVWRSRGDDGLAPACPYLALFALGGGALGGLFVVVRSAQSEWAAGNAIVSSLHLLGEGDPGGGRMGMPF
jgi:hypothetical protein